MPSDKTGPDAARRADEALMVRIAAGDAQAFSELVDTRLDRVMAVARRMLGNDADAQDVAQEALLRLWRQADRWDGGRAQISTWLYRVTVNLCIDRLRAHREDATAEVPETPIPASQQQTMEEDDLRDFMDAAI